MHTPEFLYHGSPYLLDIIKPQPANGACPAESLTAVYAACTIRKIIPFTLPIRSHPDKLTGVRKRAFSCEDGLTQLIYGSLDPNGVGYIYKLKADSFRPLDEWQWVSEQDCIPVEVTKIGVADYWDTITFSEDAKKIETELYGITFP